MQRFCSLHMIQVGGIKGDLYFNLCRLVTSTALEAVKNSMPPHTLLHEARSLWLLA